MQLQQLEQNDDMKYVLQLIEKHGGIDRLGKLFSTGQNNYLYDSGTGKVICLDANGYSIFKWLFGENQSHDDIFSLIGSGDLDYALHSVREIIEQENLLQMPIITEFISVDHKERLAEVLDTELRMITLEVTEKCNLRCKYCIYNDDFEGERDFASCEMTYETAEAAINMLVEHSGPVVGVTFYGGEPLLRFDLIRHAVEYAQKQLSHKELVFSITTNATMLTKEMAAFFASIKGFGVLCSIDGPEYIHNQYRTYQHGGGSFHDALRGLKYLYEAYGAENFQINVGVSMVFTPPHTSQRIQDIQNFFDGLEWLPKNFRKVVSYPEPGSIDDITIQKNSVLSKASLGNKDDDKEVHLIEWTINEDKKGRSASNLFTAKMSDDLLLIAHNRSLLNVPQQPSGLNGCCVPGNRRLYVCANGDIKICEKMGLCPPMGNVYSGLDLEQIKKIYVQEYEEKSIQECNNCWAFRLCGVCYIKTYKVDGLDEKKKKLVCEDAKAKALNALEYYHAMLEIDPEKLMYLNDIKIT